MTELAAAPERAVVPVPSGASRAQRLALAAALGSQSLLACAETRDAEPPITVPVYGAPLAGNQGAPAAGSAQPAAGRGGGGRFDAGTPLPTPVYGAPAPLAGQPAPVPPPKRPDAGPPPEEDAGTEPTAGSGGRGGMAVPVYGAPIPEYGAPPPPKD
jgi:hypothetical protein